MKIGVKDLVDAISDARRGSLEQSGGIAALSPDPVVDNALQGQLYALGTTYDGPPASLARVVQSAPAQWPKVFILRLLSILEWKAKEHTSMATHLGTD